LKQASANEIGGVMLNYATNTTSRNYALQKDSNGNAFVNVPWANDNTKNTAGSSGVASKLYLVGASSRSASGVQTNTSSSEVYTQSGNLFATGFFETSDERLKNFGDKVSVDFDKLLSLKKNYFTWKD
jgi:hypothetical protein